MKKINKKEKLEIIENCLILFSDSACKQTYDIKSGVTAVVEYMIKILGDHR